MFLLQTVRQALCMPSRIQFWRSLSCQFCQTLRSILMHNHSDRSYKYLSLRPSWSLQNVIANGIISLTQLKSILFNYFSFLLSLLIFYPFVRLSFQYHFEFQQPINFIKSTNFRFFCPKRGFQFQIWSMHAFYFRQQFQPKAFQYIFLQTQEDKASIKKSLDKMKMMDLNFIQIKTKKSPTSKALQSITTQKLKPYYNTVYQLLQIRKKQQKPINQVFLDIQDKMMKKMPEIVLKRRIAQQTLDFQIVKPLEKKHFSNQTLTSRIKKNKSVPKFYCLTESQRKMHQQKDGCLAKFEKFRNLSKTFSESTITQKKKYNILQRWHKIVDNHYESLQLEHRFISAQRDDEHLAFNKNQNRFKIQANNYKWVENTLISNDSQYVSLVRKEKSKYFMEKGTDLYFFKGIKKNQIKECEQIIEQDPELKNLSLNPTIQTTNIPQVKTMYEFTKNKLNNLISNYETTRQCSPIRPSPKKTRSLDRSIKKKSSKRQSPFKQYENYKKTQDKNPQIFRIGDRNSNFRTTNQKFDMLTKMKQHQKLKYTTKVMGTNLHKKALLKLI